MMRDGDADDDAASTASSLDDLPGPDEFLATAIQKLALRVTPERASPGGGARGHSGSPAGASRDGSGAFQPGDDDAASSRASSVDYDDEEREAVVNFLAAAASPLRAAPAPPVDDRPENSPKRAMEEMTASLKIEHKVAEAVVEDILDEAEMRVAYPAASFRGGVGPFRFEPRREGDAEAPETPMETAPTSPSPSVGANLHLLRDAEHMQSLQQLRGSLSLAAGTKDADAEAWASLSPGREKAASAARAAADEAMRAARARLSDALSKVATSLVRSLPAEQEAPPPRDGADETELDPDAAEVAEAIASVWRACDAASRELASAMEARDASESAAPVVGVGPSHVPASFSVSPRGGARAAAKRAMLEEAVFSAWMQSGDTSSNLMFSEGPLPTAETWPLSPGGSRSRTADAERFAAAAADAAFAAASPGARDGPDGERLSAAGDAAAAENDATYLSPGGRDRARRWRAVVGRLALASLRRVQSELGAEDAVSLSLGAEDSFRIGSDLDRADTTSTFVPVSEMRSADDVSASPPLSRPRSPPFAVRRSRARSSLEWQDLSLIASYMTTTRLLSASLDEWRARTAAAKTRRQRERERRRATAMAERERSRVVFARGVFLGWRDAVRRQTRERRARYGSVSRASIRKLTRSPLDRISPSEKKKSLFANGAFSGSGGGGYKTLAVSRAPDRGFGSADRFGSASAIDLGFAGREPGGDAFTPRTAPPPLKLFGTGS